MIAYRVCFGSALAFLFVGHAAAAGPEVKPLLAALRDVGPEGQGHRAATAAWQKLAQADAEQLPEILAGLAGANDLAVNWIRAAADAVAQRTVRNGGKLPVASLEKFLADTNNAPRGRRVAYELIARIDATAESRLIPGLLNDPSLELRRDAVAQALAQAETLAKDEAQKDAAVAAYRRAFAAARDTDQIDKSAAQIRKLGGKADISAQFGFIQQWKLIGPFDNVDKRGFEIAYPPEVKVDLDVALPGKSGEVKWFDHLSKDDHGVVDLNQAVGKHKGAIAYAYVEFLSDRERPCELRLGCICANKVWLNGELLTTNNIYHANSHIDQYIGRSKLLRGRNSILVKIAQNEQTEQWAQDWKFQLRVCDAIGTAILSQDRPIEQARATDASATVR